MTGPVFRERNGIAHATPFLSTQGNSLFHSKKYAAYLHI